MAGISVEGGEHITQGVGRGKSGRRHLVQHSGASGCLALAEAPAVGLAAMLRLPPCPFSSLS